MLKIGIIFGGESVEHEVSIITAVQAMNYFDKKKYEIIPLYIDKKRHWYTGNILKEMDAYKDLEAIPSIATEVTLTKKNNEFILQKKNSLFNKTVGKIDLAFPIVHGKGVEDGSLSGYLETIGIPYVGPSMLGASVGQDKVVQKQIMASNGIPVVDYTWFYEFEYLNEEKEILKKIKKLGYPVIVKPARLGSSIGISIAESEKDIKECLEDALKYDQKICVEKVIKNLKEVDCAVLGTPENMECSLIGEMTFDSEFFTFEDKYLGNGSKAPKKGPKSNGKLNTSGFKIPADIPKKIEKDIFLNAEKAFKCLDLSGITRFDFLIDEKEGKVYVNEPNTIPGCLAFFFYTPKGKKYPELLDELVKLSIKKYKEEQKKTTTFDSNVLSTFDGSSTKGMKGKMM